jgi:uncharacterized protein YkwD
MPAQPDGMERGVRTIFLVVAASAALIAVPPPASALADLGDLLQILSPGGPEPPQPSPPPSTLPAPGGPQPLDLPAGPSKDPLLASESSCGGQSDPSLPAATQVRAMVCMLSYARVAKGLPALRVYKPLRVSATHKARDIRRCQRLSHEACGRDPWYWFTRVHFFKGTSLAGEILEMGRGEAATVRAAVRSWLGSKPHRAALLHSGFNLVGIGTTMGRFGGVRGMRIWVAHLGYIRGRSNHPAVFPR